MPLNAFIVRPFMVKELLVGSSQVAEKLTKLVAPPGQPPGIVVSVAPIGGGEKTTHWTARIDFERLHGALLQPTLERLRIRGETAGAVVVAGNIREDMFNRLVTADLVIADLSIHNPNVFYELGVRQAFRDKYTFLIRCDLSDYPFDLKTDRYFEYNLVELAEDPDAVISRLVTALDATLNSTDADSPIFKLLPQLEAEDRARFIAVPEDFREEVEWARHQRREEHLSLMAVECEGYLWEVEGLRVIGRAQFECNFVAGAKSTWEMIVNRYTDDVEANSVLSTIYQRMNDMKKSEQALSRVARTRSLSPSRLSQLRSLTGRNLKAAWVDQWHVPGRSRSEQQRAALTSPLLQLAFDAYNDSFKTDLNNAYAGLNALTMLVIQTELAQRLPDDWKAIQRRPDDAERELARRRARIAQLIAAVNLAVESDRDRLHLQGQVDPWFNLLEAAVACIVSNQPEYVAQLYQQAMHFAPESAEASIRSSLEVYQELEIGGCEFDPSSTIGCVATNVARAIKVLSHNAEPPPPSNELQRILMFVGLRVDAEGGAPGGRGREVPGFPPASVADARQAIERAIDAEIKLDGRIVIGIAAGANGGDLLFHEICRDRGIPTRLCLALRKPQYVGQYVAPAGRDWVEKFSTVHRHLRDLESRGGVPTRGPLRSIREFTDSSELPRWLKGKPFYNVGRRNNQWMLQHAIVTANEIGENAEITLLALWNEAASKAGIGGIGHVIRSAAMQGIKVHAIQVPQAASAAVPEGGTAPEAQPARATTAAPAEGRIDSDNRAPRPEPTSRQAPGKSLTPPTLTRQA